MYRFLSLCHENQRVALKRRCFTWVSSEYEGSNRVTLKSAAETRQRSAVGSVLNKGSLPLDAVLEKKMTTRISPTGCVGEVHLGRGC